MEVKAEEFCVKGKTLEKGGIISAGGGGSHLALAQLLHLRRLRPRAERAAHTSRDPWALLWDRGAGGLLGRFCRTQGLRADTLSRSEVCLAGSSFLLSGFWGKVRGCSVFSSTLTTLRSLLKTVRTRESNGGIRNLET